MGVGRLWNALIGVQILAQAAIHRSRWRSKQKSAGFPVHKSICEDSLKCIQEDSKKDSESVTGVMLCDEACPGETLYMSMPPPKIQTGEPIEFYPAYRS